MRLPSKVLSYKESVLAGFVPILKCLSIHPMSHLNLYSECRKTLSIDDFIDVLDCLFALGAIEYDEKGGLLRYVDRDTM